MDKLKFAFFGATNYSKELLLFLIKNNFIPTVIFSIPQEFHISYSDKKVVNTNYANIKEIANNYNISYYEIDSIDGQKTKDYYQTIKELNLDLLLILGWYYMIPKNIRGLAKYGAWGIHASLLPKYAGGAPLVWAMINGEEEAGVTLFRMEDGVDDGDIISQKSFSIDYDDTIKDVYDKATIESKNILKEVLSNIDDVKFQKQNKSNIEIYPQRKPEDGVINWNENSETIYDFIRAQTLPYPCAFSNIEDKKIKIIDSKEVNINNRYYKCGEIVQIANQTLVATNNNFLELGMIDDGKQQYKFKDYARINNLWGGYSRAKNLRMAA